MTDCRVTFADIKFLIPILLLGILSQFGSDNYLPSFPMLSEYFHVPNSMIKWSMSTFLFGMGCLQPILGPLSDFIGRKPILYISFFVVIVGSLLCALSDSIGWFLFARFIQGMGFGSGIALFRAIMRDCFSGKKLAKLGAIALMCFGLTPPLAPITGGYVERYLHWQVNFYFIAFVSFIYILYMMFCFPETSLKKPLQDVWYRVIAFNLKRMMRCRAFVVNLIIAGLSYATIIVYLTMSPYLFQTVLHMDTVTYGWTNLVNAAGFFIGGVVNASLIGRVALNQLMLIGGWLVTLGAFFLVATGLFHWVATLPVLASIFVIFMGCAFIFSNASTAAIQPFPESAGLVGAMFGSLQVTIAATTGFFSGMIAVHDQEIMGVILLMFGLIMLLLKSIYR